MKKNKSRWKGRKRKKEKSWIVKCLFQRGHRKEVKKKEVKMERKEKKEKRKKLDIQVFISILSSR